MTKTSKKELNIDTKQQLKNMPSISSIGSPGSVYDQYFDAFNDSSIHSPNFLPNQALRLTHKKSSMNGYPVISFDSNQPYDNESDVYDDMISLPSASLDVSSKQLKNKKINDDLKQKKLNRDRVSIIKEEEEIVEPQEEETEPEEEVEPEPKSEEIVAKEDTSTSKTKNKEKEVAQLKSDEKRKSVNKKEKAKPETKQVRQEKEEEEEEEKEEEEKEEKEKEEEEKPVVKDSNKKTKQKEVMEEKDSKEEENNEPEKEKGEEEEEEGDGEDGIFDYYDILGLEKTDDIEEIINQFKKEVVLAGFSRNSEEGQARIKELTEAYVVLGNLENKLNYDKTIELEDMSLVELWKPKEAYDPDDIFSQVFEEPIKKELFKPEYYFTPMSYVAGAIIGFILFSWPGLIIFAYFCGKVGDWEDNRCPPSRELIGKLSDNQRNALLHAMSRYMPKD